MAKHLQKTIKKDRLDGLLIDYNKDNPVEMSFPIPTKNPPASTLEVKITNVICKLRLILGNRIIRVSCLNVGYLFCFNEFLLFIYFEINGMYRLFFV